MNIPDFNEKKRFFTRINNTSEVLTVNDATRQAFDSYVKYFESSGFLVTEERESEKVAFTALRKDDIGVFINYYHAAKTLTAVIEENTKYFDFKDEHRTLGSVSPQITQLSLEIFGMSYAIRLSDGRFIVIDGGRELEPDATKLYECLKRGSVTEKPIVAAWIFTHQHPDHFFCFMTFVEKYSEKVIIEKCMFTFNEGDSTKTVSENDTFGYNVAPTVNIGILNKKIEKRKIPKFALHTGQQYVIGDATLEILAGIDDTIHLTKDLNDFSLIIRMELGGQVILWGADNLFCKTDISLKYDTYLKADILQIPHHGCQSGSAESQIEGYRLIKPSVCFLPEEDFNTFTANCTHRPGTKFILRDAGVDEIITGETERTITLPYRARKEAKAELERKYLSGLNSCGSTSWIFSGLNTSNEEDLTFTFLNTTKLAATIDIELFFEDKTKAVKFIKATAPQLSTKTISIIGDEIDGDALYINFNSLKSLGIPENADFAVRFNSDIPIVVSHAKHQPSYISRYIN